MIPEEKKSATEEKVEKLYYLRYEFWHGEQSFTRDQEILDECRILSREIGGEAYWWIIEDIVSAATRLGKTVDEVFCVFDILGIDYSKEGGVIYG